jgi:predicted aspartyl protease
MVPVDLRKGSGGEGYYPYSALVDSGATYNFISQSVADKLRLEAVKAGRKRNRRKMPLLITTVNGELLRITAVVRQM